MTFVLTSLFEKITLCFSENPIMYFRNSFRHFLVSEHFSVLFTSFLVATPNDHKTNA